MEAISRPANLQRHRLTAYQVSTDLDISLKRAVPNRGWMSDTDAGFAKRCLPMLLANQHGWSICTTRTVSVEWNGSQGSSSLSIAPDSIAGSPSSAVSHFGHGILTWRLPYLFRTSPGYNLLIRGPANSPIDGASPLEGLVETDWAPATATMNWVITRSEERIVFEAGSAIGMLVPVRRGELEACDPELRDVSTDPDEQSSYNAWRDSRNEFLEQLTTRSERGRSSWQGDYFTGGFGRSQIHDHQTRLRLHDFQR